MEREICTQMTEQLQYDCCFTKENNWFRYRTGAIIVEDNSVLFVGSKSLDYLYTVGGGVHMGETAEQCISREVFEETGIHYEIDHLAVICENFFKGHGGVIDELDCHCLEFYFLMKSKGSKALKSNSINQDNEIEEMHWISIEDIQNTNIKPSFLKDRIKDIINGTSVMHIVTEVDK